MDTTNLFHSPIEEHEKVLHLRSVLLEAISQIRKKISFIGERLRIIEHLGNDEKIMCTLMLEIKELLKAFPRVCQNGLKNSGTGYDNNLDKNDEQLQNFIKNILAVVEDSLDRLFAVENFVELTDDAPSIMALAVTVRDLSKYLKIISAKGVRVGAGAPHVPLPQNKVVEMVSLYSQKIEKDDRAAATLKSPQSPRQQNVAYISHSSSSDNETSSLRSESDQENTEAKFEPAEIVPGKPTLNRPVAKRPMKGCIPSDRNNRPGRRTISSGTVVNSRSHAPKSPLVKPSGEENKQKEKENTIIHNNIQRDEKEEAHENNIGGEESQNQGKNEQVLSQEQVTEIKKAAHKKFGTLSKNRPALVKKMLETEQLEIEDLSQTNISSSTDQVLSSLSSLLGNTTASHSKSGNSTSAPVVLAGSSSFTKESLSISPHNKVLKQGKIKRQYGGVFGKTWKELWAVLDGDAFSFYASEKVTFPLRTYRLRDIKSSSWQKLTTTNSADELETITLFISKKKIHITSESPVELLKWAICIDTAQENWKIEPSLFNPLEKHYLLELGFKRQFKGGEIKSSYDEEWTYNHDGSLSSNIGLDVALNYRWDGEMLIGTDEISTRYGSGKWDGLKLTWFDEAANGVLSSASTTFFWNEELREYTHASQANQVWKWSRHFLVSKFGAGEWIVEGDIPQPVVMFLQMMRSSRLSREW